ncbi:MAG: hypothetical protein ABR583_01790 [Gaiellaceae bacterium]
MSARRPLTEEEIRTLPLRELALRLLAELDSVHPTGVGNAISRVLNKLPSRPGAIRVGGRSWLSEPELTRLLGEAWDWLYINGLTASEPTHPSTRFVTRFGGRVVADPTLLPE